MTRMYSLSQRTRRAIAVVSLAGLPGMFVWSAFWLKTTAPVLLWRPVSFAFVLATALGSFVLYSYVRDRANRNAPLDERQRRLRDQAWILCYEVLSAVVVVVVVVLGVTVLGFGRTVTLDGTVVSGLAICTALSIPLPPVAAMAWVEPDAPAEA